MKLYLIQCGEDGYEEEYGMCTTFELAKKVVMERVHEGLSNGKDYMDATWYYIIEAEFDENGYSNGFDSIPIFGCKDIEEELAKEGIYKEDYEEE